MHILIFCIGGDAVATGLHDALFQKGERALRLVTAAELSVANWLHEADADARFFSRIRLSDGFIIEPAMIKTIVNRIPYFMMPHFINAADRSYAEMEMFALYISFLHSVQDRVIDGMPTRHISAAYNPLYYALMAAKAGMKVLDHEFTSSPRWQQARDLSPMEPTKKPAMQWHKKSPSLVWQNKPVLYSQPFTSLERLEVVGDQVLSCTTMSRPLTIAIKAFSAMIDRTVYELTLALVKNRYFFYAANPLPASLSAPALEAYCNLLMAPKNKRK